MSSALVNEKRALKIWHLKGKFGKITPANSSPLLYPSYPPKKKKKKIEEIPLLELATLATLLGNVEGTERMNYPSLCSDLKIAEHTKSCPCVNGCLLFACIKVKIAALFCDTHFVSQIVPPSFAPSLDSQQPRGKHYVRGLVISNA